MAYMIERWAQIISVVFGMPSAAHKEISNSDMKTTEERKKFLQWFF